MGTQVVFGEKKDWVEELTVTVIYRKVCKFNRNHWQGRTGICTALSLIEIHLIYTAFCVLISGLVMDQLYFLTNFTGKLMLNRE